MWYSHPPMFSYVLSQKKHLYSFFTALLGVSGNYNHKLQVNSFLIKRYNNEPIILKCSYGIFGSSKPFPHFNTSTRAFPPWRNAVLLESVEQANSSIVSYHTLMSLVVSVDVIIFSLTVVVAFKAFTVFSMAWVWALTAPTLIFLKAFKLVWRSKLPLGTVTEKHKTHCLKSILFFFFHVKKTHTHVYKRKKSIISVT